MSFKILLKRLIIQHPFWPLVIDKFTLFSLIRIEVPICQLVFDLGLVKPHRIEYYLMCLIFHAENTDADKSTAILLETHL